MVIFLHGPDSYRKHHRIKALRQAFRDKFDQAGFSLAKLTASDFTIDDFRKHTKSAGLFSTKRLLVLYDLWELSKEDRDLLLKELDQVDEDTILVIEGDKPPRKDNQLFKRLLKSQTVEEYSELSGSQLASFIREHAKEHGATIEPAAVRHLASSIGNDLWRLSSEVKKLAHQQPEITEQLVKESVDKSLDENIFHFTDALGARNAALATDLLNQQFELGANEQYLITMIARQIGILAKVKKTKGKGLKLHPYVIEKSLKQSEQFTDRRLLQLLWKLLEIDETLKTESADPRTLLSAFVADACLQ